MATVKEKPISTFNITGNFIGGHQTGTKPVATARGKSAIIDEPIQRGHRRGSNAR